MNSHPSERISRQQASSGSPQASSAVPSSASIPGEPIAEPVRSSRRRRRRAPRLRPTPRQELDILVRARYPVIYVTSWEEERVQEALEEVAQRGNKKLFVWTVTEGIVPVDSHQPSQSPRSSGRTSDPLAALDAVLEHVDPAIFLFKDFHAFTDEKAGNIKVIRRIRDVADRLRNTYKTIVLVSPFLRLAPELSKDVTVVDFGLPTIDDLDRLLNRVIDEVRDNPRIRIELTPESRERLLHAARGLTLREAENVFAKTLVVDGRLDADDIRMVFSEKQQIIRKSGLLEYCETREQWAHVAGLENLKSWFQKRSIAFTDRAKEFGLPAPRGVLLLGVQGCGKSLCAKAVSSLWRLPLLRFDMGRMFSSLVGSSEENVRRAIQTAESVAPAILWVDEIDKAFAGTNQAGADGGTSARVFGTLLTWLSEKTAPVFVIATANDISRLPPELLRKGRLDEIFFVDLPSPQERREIFAIHLRKRGRDPELFDLDRLVECSDGFSGAEIEEAIVSALFDAFSEEMELDSDILGRALKQTVPLSQTMSEELTALRNWAEGRARLASHREMPQPRSTGRKLEF